MNNPLRVSLDNIIPLTEARDHFSQIVAEVQKDKLYVLTKGGKPAVAIVDVKYLEQITGGNVNATHVETEIQKNPAKVGRPEMVKHDTPPPRPLTPERSDGGQAMTTPPQPKADPPQVEKPEPMPEPQPKADRPWDDKPAPTPPPPAQTPPPRPLTPERSDGGQAMPPPPSATIETSFSTPNTPPAKPVGTLDMHPIADQDDQEKTPSATRVSPDDKTGPAQYSNNSNDNAEPDDMPID